LCNKQLFMVKIDSTQRLLQKRQIEARRNEIAKNAKRSLKDYHAGKLMALTADEAIQKLKSL